MLAANSANTLLVDTFDYDFSWYRYFNFKTPSLESFLLDENNSTLNTSLLLLVFENGNQHRLNSSPRAKPVVTPSTMFPIKARVVPCNARCSVQKDAQLLVYFLQF